MSDKTWPDMEWEVTAPLVRVSEDGLVPIGRVVVALCKDERMAKNIVDYSYSYEGLEYHAKNV